MNRRLRIAHAVDRVGHTLRLPGCLQAYLCNWVGREEMKVCPDCIAREVTWTNLERGIEELAAALRKRTRPRRADAEADVAPEPTLTGRIIRRR